MQVFVICNKVAMAHGNLLADRRERGEPVGAAGVLTEKKWTTRQPPAQLQAKCLWRNLPEAFGGDAGRSREERAGGW